jgi:hypothetical protein
MFVKNQPGAKCRTVASSGNPSGPLGLGFFDLIYVTHNIPNIGI